jgi:hypothetical protein
MQNYIKHIKSIDKDPFEKVTNDTHRFKIIQAIRQSGKTYHICSSALAYSQTNIHKTIFIGTVNEEMCRFIKEQIVLLYSKLKPNEKFRMTSTTKNLISFDNGSDIRIGRITPYCVRGMAVDYFLLDEFAYVDFNVAKEFIVTAFPCMVNKKESKLEIYSTRKNRSTKKNMFWNIWANHNVWNFKSFTIPSKECPHLKPKLKQMKSIMTRPQYEREFIIKKV